MTPTESRISRAATQIRADLDYHRDALRELGDTVATRDTLYSVALGHLRQILEILEGTHD